LKKIGFIGCGTMGLPMINNLLKTSFEVTAFDVNDEALNKAVVSGAKCGKSPKQVAEESEVVITMLPASRHVEAVVLGADGVLEGLAKGSIYIDMSTIEPLVSQRIEKKVLEKGASMIDAPVSGGQSGAKAGTLTIMVGGPAEVLQKVKHVLESMGKNIIHVHEQAGMGEMVKVVNQLMMGITFLATTEALMIGLKGGLPLERMYEVIKSSSGSNWLLERYFPVTVMKENFEPGFKLDLLHKDIGLALETAKNLKVLAPLGAISQQIYEYGRLLGKGSYDFSIMWKELSKVVGLSKDKTNS